VKEVVGKPILYAGTGEKLKRSRCSPRSHVRAALGCGDMLTLIEKGRGVSFDTAQKERAEEIMREDVHA